MFLTVTDDSELDGVARSKLADESGESAGATDFDAVDLCDDVAFFQASFVGGAAGSDGVHASGRVEVGAAHDGEVVGFGDVGSEVDVVGAGVSAGGGAGGNEAF